MEDNKMNVNADLMIKNKKSAIEYAIGFCFLAIAFWAVCVIVTKTTGEDIWYDEVFSLVFSGKSINELIALTSADVHPPLYYIYLKAVCMVAGGVFGLSQVVAAKIASVIPMLIICIVILTYYRKRIGFAGASAAVLLISVMPQLATYYVEIRMYSFGMLLIFMAYLFGERLIEDGKSIDYMLFCLIGIFISYTQYFACIAVVGLYCFIGVVFITKKKYKSLIRLLICAGVSVLVYIPWIPRFLSQISEVRSDYWIQPMDIKSVPGCIKFFFLPMGGIKGYTAAAIGIFAVILIYFLSVRGKELSTKEVYVEFAPYSMLAIIITVGYIFSFLGRPIFVYRYMIPVAATLYMSVAFAFGRVARNTKNYIWLLMIPLVLIGYYSINTFKIEENNKLDKIDYAVDAIYSLPENSVIISNFDHVAVLMDYYLKDKTIYLYEDLVDSIASKMYDNDGQMLLDKDLEKVVLENDNVYFFGSFNSREELLEDFKTRGIDNELVYDSCLIERYYFNIYRLKK